MTKKLLCLGCEEKDFSLLNGIHTNGTTLDIIPGKYPKLSPGISNPGVKICLDSSLIGKGSNASLISRDATRTIRKLLRNGEVDGILLVHRNELDMQIAQAIPERYRRNVVVLVREQAKQAIPDRVQDYLNLGMHATGNLKPQVFTSAVKYVIGWF